MSQTLLQKWLGALQAAMLPQLEQTLQAGVDSAGQLTLHQRRGERFRYLIPELASCRHWALHHYPSLP